MEEIMTASQVAALLQIHLRTVHRLSRQGVLPGRRIGRRWRFSRREVIALVSSQSRLRSLVPPLEPSGQRAERGGQSESTAPGSGPGPAEKV
jgi:excisionase family DNA binding protein